MKKLILLALVACSPDHKVPKIIEMESPSRDDAAVDEEGTDYVTPEAIAAGADREALGFFNRLSAVLDINDKTNEVREHPKVVLFVQNEHYGPLTPAEHRFVVVRAPSLRMRDDMNHDVILEHRAPDGKSFTVDDLAHAIEKTELAARGDRDLHHIFFEGIERKGDLWIVHWGS